MSRLNEIIHQPTRLKIMAALAGLDMAEKIEFTSLSKLLHLTDGNFGAHLLKLEDCGYLTAEKLFVDRKPKTLISITLHGRFAFEEHVAALRQLLLDPKRPRAQAPRKKHESNPSPIAEPEFTSPAPEPGFLD
jgi:DNA-binding transcriptional ArsR family regulator